MRILQAVTKYKHHLMERVAGRERQKEEDSRAAELRELLLKTQNAIAASRQGMMMADSEDLTDMYIYAIKASELQYAHLLQMMKKEAS